ncbi:MAG: ATP synthase F1 subunit epsilon [Planctomycetes bacterium]|nr:ATP synthase F1 subunit epsilon [Planctomycetota bacterium]
MAEERRLDVSLVSPDGVIWEGKSPFVVLPAVDGEIGIAPGHAPLIAALGAGEARVHTEGCVLSFVLFRGFLEVLDDRVHVIVDRAEKPQDVDAAAAKDALRALDEPRVRDASKHEEEILLRRLAQARLKACGAGGTPGAARGAPSP